MTEPISSLDVIERKRFKPGPSPLDRPIAAPEWTKGKAPHAEAPPMIVLDGLWELAEGGEDAERLGGGAWTDAIPARVPGSVHTALVEAGKLPDPSFGENAPLAKAYSHRTWWYRRTFEAVPGMQSPRLLFDGVSPACEVWLNGRPLGYHNGAFGGPHVELGEPLRKRNELIVKVHPAPLGNEWNVWHQTVVFNCNYGWHYVNLPAVGIWRPVRIRGAAEVEIGPPLVAATSAANAAEGLVDISLDLTGRSDRWSGTLRGTIEPDNFDGPAQTFELRVGESERRRELRIRAAIESPRLWWPLDMGEQPLYRLKLSFAPEGGGLPDSLETTFGIRSIEMAPLPEGSNPERYDWTFVVNGKPFFAKGSGWCTMDALMDFSREKYDHFLTLAAAQHVKLLRAWGGGMPETDDFYDLCDRKGILVMQEWPTCWGSHVHQPADALEETVRLNTLRLRNHPSLVMWGGGNEIGSGLDSASMDMMGRLSVELDGTRPFHLTDPWGGSTHDHIVWNGWTPAYSFDYYANLESVLLGEYGLASAPNLESVRRYMPKEELEQWPPEPGKSFYHHLPAFDTRDEMRILTEFAESFVRCDSVEAFVTGTQLAQATSLRHKMEQARTRWPHETGNITYKLNDVYIGVSWATVDWYGAPKMAHYFAQDANSPLAAVVRFGKLNSPEEDQELPVYVLDDNGELDGDWTVRVRAYDPALALVSEKTFPGKGRAPEASRVGSFELKAAPPERAPALIVSELLDEGGSPLYRTFYWLNFDARQGVLMRLPKTSLEVAADDASGTATVVNVGAFPAVGVELYRDSAEPFVAGDNFFWLDPGESKTVSVSETAGVGARGWNA